MHTVKGYEVKIFASGDPLPDLPRGNFFHSPEFFHILEKTPGQSPFMAVVTNGEGCVVAHLLAYLHRRGSLFPPYLYTQGRIYGEGEYVDDEPQEELFGLMLHAITRKIRHKLCLFIEQSDASRKMFGYRYFRQNGYFPVPWMEVRQSLHSLSPRERLSPKTIRQIDRLRRQGVTTREPESEDEVRQFYKLLKAYSRWKIRRIIPPVEQLLALYHSDSAKIFLTFFHGKMIGGCLCALTAGNAYLWYLASLRKRYRSVHPDLATVWYAIEWAWKHNYAHISFLDVGLPTNKSRYRQFFLRFGGKPIAKYRWFRFFRPWVNRLLGWVFRD